MTKLSIKDFYNDKTLLLTGITGFVGKVLLEKLLREFSTSLKCIYVLIREKKSQTPEQRLAQLFFQSPIFEPHKDKIDLVHAINGDITAKGMALSENDRRKLIDEVNIVFHSAATVNFTGIFEKFIQQNIDGTNSMLQLCQKMIHLQSIVYVSTAYGHHSLLGRPNPYTLSKSITEWMIQERYPSLPIIICRPSIVSNSFREPIPGWCDSLAGCAGAVILTSLGIARSFIFDVNCKADIIPVDMVVNSLIISAAYRASSLFTHDKQVIHVTLGQNQITWGEFFNMTINLSDTLPPMKLIRPIKLHGCRRYILKDPDSTLKMAINRQHRIKYILITMKIIVTLFCYWLIRSPLHLVDIFYSYIVDLSVCIGIVLYFLNFYG
nr:fatty acyl-CoA reductase 1-like [Dermatophagoides farinae]